MMTQARDVLSFIVFRNKTRRSASSKESVGPEIGMHSSYNSQHAWASVKLRLFYEAYIVSEAE